MPWGVGGVVLVLSIALSTKAQEGDPAPSQRYVALPPISPTLEASRSVTCFMVRGLYPLCRSWITGSNSSANTWKDMGRHAALQIQRPTEPLPPAPGTWQHRGPQRVAGVTSHPAAQWQPTGQTLPRQVGLRGKEEEVAGLQEQLLCRSPVSPWGHAPAAWAE